jgi:hypothetical protein
MQRSQTRGMVIMTARRPVLHIVRYVIPLAVVVAGIVIFVFAPDSSRCDGAAAFIGAGLSILLLNVLYRAGVRGDRDRDEEERARTYFDEHGHWQDEESEKTPHTPA